MDNSLCPCSKLDWTGFDMTQPHHPDCQQIQTLEIDAPPVYNDLHPLAYWRLNDGNGTAMISGTIDHVIIHEKEVPPRRVDIVLAQPPSQEQLMEMALKKLRELLNLPAPKTTGLEDTKAKARNGDIFGYTTQNDLPGVGLKKGIHVKFSFDREPKMDDLIFYSEIDGSDYYIGRFHLWDWDGMLITTAHTCRMRFIRPRTIAVITEVDSPDSWQLPKRTFYNGD